MMELLRGNGVVGVTTLSIHSLPFKMMEWEKKPTNDEYII